MKTERIEFTGCGMSLPGYLWTPDSETKAVILVIHGMTEHAHRYESFARFLAERGFAVAAYDLRGHGVHAPDPECAAMAPGDWEKSIEDIDLVMGQLLARFALPVYLMGFSLGSFLVREYMDRVNTRMDGVILMGTGWQSGGLIGLMRAIVKTQIRKAGYEKTTPLVCQLSFGAHNQKFKPNRTSFDWLCADEAEIDAYLADPLCRRDIASGTFYELLGSMARTAKPAAHPCNGWRPVLVISGDCDPVGDFGKGAARVRDLLKKAGYPVRFQLFPGARHVLLCERASGQAESARLEIAGWLDAHI